jgi:ADP-ribosylglycohydrolase/fructose-1,6-bisphosphatase/inositol monophosphatase family enzyme
MRTKIMHQYDQELRAAVEAAREAGALLRRELHREGGPRGRGAKSPADAEAEDLIRARLTDAFPKHGFHAEEHPGKDRPAHDAGKHTWLVDPNDGTSGFIKGWRGAAVSIALARNGELVLGVVYAYAAPDDNGDLLAWAEGCGPMTRNGVPVERRPWPKELDGALVAVSQGADGAVLANARLVAPARYWAMPSIAYRLALVAAGDADVAVSVNGPGDLDYAGGHALLKATGGVLVDQSGAQVTYHADGRSSVSFCFGGAPALVGDLRQREWGGVLSAPRSAISELDLVKPRAGASVADAGVLARAQGCLFGQVAGDSLGGLVEFEFHSAAGMADAFPDGVRDLEDGGHFDLLAGQPTDDSELALMLARTLVAKGGFDADAVARAYAYWVTSGAFDVGGTTGQALYAAADAAKHGKGVAEASRAAANRGSKANGSVMRVSPLAIFAHALPSDEVAALARQDSSLTHPNPVCCDASATLTVAIAHAISTGATAQAVYDYTCAWAASAGLDAEVTAALRGALDERPRSYTQNMGLVTIALQNAFYQLLHTASLEQGIIDTVMQCGDTDTNAAIAGALLGGVHGRDAVPWRWRSRILCCRPMKELAGVRMPRPRPFWSVDVMVLAELLLVAGAPTRKT